MDLKTVTRNQVYFGIFQDDTPLPVFGRKSVVYKNVEPGLADVNTVRKKMFRHEHFQISVKCPPRIRAIRVVWIRGKRSLFAVKAFSNLNISIEQ